MKNPIEKLKEIDAKFFDILENDRERAKPIVAKILLGTILSLWGATALWLGITVGLKYKENKDFENGKFNPVIKEANVLSVSGWTSAVKVDINGNGKFDKGDVSFFDGPRNIAADSQSIVYIDGVGKMKPLAYKRENGEYVIYKTPSSYFNKAEKLDKKFYDYMNNKKVFDLVKIKKEIEAHTK